MGLISADRPDARFAMRSLPRHATWRSRTACERAVSGLLEGSSAGNTTLPVVGWATKTWSAR